MRNIPHTDLISFDLAEVVEENAAKVSTKTFHFVLRQHSHLTFQVHFYKRFQTNIIEVLEL